MLIQDLSPEPCTLETEAADSSVPYALETEAAGSSVPQRPCILNLGAGVMVQVEVMIVRHRDCRSTTFQISPPVRISRSLTRRNPSAEIADARSEVLSPIGVQKPVQGFPGGRWQSRQRTSDSHIPCLTRSPAFFSFLKLFLTTPQASGLASVGFSSPPPPCLFVPLVKATAPPQVKGYQPPLGIDGSASPSTGFSASLSTGFSARLSTSFSIGFPTGSSTTYNQLSTFTHSNEILHSSVLQTATAVRMPC